MSKAAGSHRKPLLSLSDLSSAEVIRLGDIAFRYHQSPEAFSGLLQGAKVGLVFTAPSTRTRSSFWSVALNLGCDILHFGPTDLQVTTGETWSDTGSILAQYLDAVVVRTNGPQQDLVEVSRHIPATINALTYEEHPTQAIADLCAMREHFGRVEQLRIAYLGQMNNTARALALLACKIPGMTFESYSPAGLGLSPVEVSALNTKAGREAIRQYDQMPDSPRPVDVVYTTRWQSMGVAHKETGWLERFLPFAITKETLHRFGGATEAVFMHDLPAIRDQEVTSDVLDGHSVTSLVAHQVRHKGSAAAAALIWALGKAHLVPE